MFESGAFDWLDPDLRLLWHGGLRPLQAESTVSVPVEQRTLVLGAHAVLSHQKLSCLFFSSFRIWCFLQHLADLARHTWHTLRPPATRLRRADDSRDPGDYENLSCGKPRLCTLNGRSRDIAHLRFNREATKFGFCHPSSDKVITY